MATKAEKRRRNVAASFTRLHTTRERATYRAQKPFWRDLTAAVVRRLEKAGTNAVHVDELFYAPEWRDQFNERLLPQLNRGVWSGAQFEADWVESAGEKQSAGLLLPDRVQAVAEASPPPSIRVDPSQEMIRDIQRWLNERAVGVWESVGDTTRKKIASAIRKGLAEGDDLDALQARVKKTLRDYTDAEARRVARTETTGAMNHGGQLERLELDIADKEWVSTLDARNRGAAKTPIYDHLTCDGQKRANEKTFTVSGQSLLYPGDSSNGASAGNVINCRCVAVAAF